MLKVLMGILIVAITIFAWMALLKSASDADDQMELLHHGGNRK